MLIKNVTRLNGFSLQRKIVVNLCRCFCLLALIVPPSLTFGQEGETQYVLDGTRHRETANISGKGYVPIELRNYFGRRALLSSFMFRYPFENADTHLKKIELQPMPSLNALRVVFDSKALFKPPFVFKGNAAFIPNTTRYFYRNGNGRVSGTCRRVNIGEPGVCSRRLTPPEEDSVLILASFSLEYDGDDHHVDNIAVHQEKHSSGDDILYFRLNDGNKDDVFSYSADYSYMPRHLFTEIGDRIGTSVDFDNVFTTQGIPLLRGFWFSYLSGDAHIRKLGVEMDIFGNGKMTYRDKSGIKPFSHKLQYATLPFR